MYAIVEILGKQYKVEKDKFIYTDWLDEKVGKTISFTDVLFIEKSITDIGLLVNQSLENKLITSKTLCCPSQ